MPLDDSIMLSTNQPSSSTGSTTVGSSILILRPRTSKKTVRFTEKSSGSIVANPLVLSEEDCRELWYSLHDLSAMRTELLQQGELNNILNKNDDDHQKNKKDTTFITERSDDSPFEGEKPSCSRSVTGGAGSSTNTKNNNDKRHYHRKLTIQCVRSAYRKGMSPEKVADISRRCSAGCVQLAALQAIHDFVAVHYHDCPPEVFADLPPVSSIQPTFPFSMHKRRRVGVHHQQQLKRGGGATNHQDKTGRRAAAPSTTSGRTTCQQESSPPTKNPIQTEDLSQDVAS